MRFAPITGGAVPQLIQFGDDADATQRWALGTVVQAVSPLFSSTANRPNGLHGTFMYAQAAGTFVPGRLVHTDKDLALLDVPDTAGTGRGFAVAVSSFTSTNKYGWICTAAGGLPMLGVTAFAAGAQYIGGAGQTSSTQANGKQLLNTRALIGATGSFTETITTQNSSKRVRVANVTGMFVGQAVSGTGVAASSTIASIDPSGAFITLNNACTASGTVTGTFTHTGYVIAQFNRPFVQGQVV